MNQYFIFYSEATIVCLIFFGIILIHDLSRIDRQEKQVKFDYALISFMLYFVSDAFWAAIISGVLPKTLFSVKLINYLLFLFMALITYNWFMYVLAVENVEKRNLPLQKFAMSFPLVVSAIAAFIIYFFFPSLMIDDSLDTNIVSTISQIIIPIIYITAILIYTIQRASKVKNPTERRMHIFVGGLPLAIVAGGLLQILLLQTVPIFCFCCAIVMVIFYIQSIESQISIDPLTGLNNRGQLLRYVSQDSNLYRDGSRTYVVMSDANDFKHINDTYGHSEGDHALIIISQSLKKAVRKAGIPVFIGRYGGDEFVLIAHSTNKENIDVLLESIKSTLKDECLQAGLSYQITISIGCDELGRSGDSFQKCLERADKKLYEDKDRQKHAAS